MSIDKNNGVLWYVLSFFGNVDELSADKRNCIDDRICIFAGGYSGDYMAGCGCWF